METSSQSNNQPNSNHPQFQFKKKWYKRWLTKKKVIFGIIIVVILAIFFVGRSKNKSMGILTDTVKRQNLTQTVLATGQVTSQTDLNLSFKVSGIVSQVGVKVGDQVKDGQILANLQQQDQAAQLTQAKGALAQAQANYQKVLAGASSQDIAVSQAAVDSAKVALTNAQTSLQNTKQQQAVAVQNAYSALLNSTISAVPNPSNVGSATVTVTGTYTGTDQGIYKIVIYNSGIGQQFLLSGLETGSGDIKTIPVPLGTRGLFIQFSGVAYNNDFWTITIPNTVASNYVTNYNAYQAALQAQSVAVASAQAAVDTAQSSLYQAQAALALKVAQARPADIQVAEAQVLSAQGQVQAAQAGLENTIIRAPADGTITQVDIKVGELATALSEVFVLQDVKNLHIESEVSEANIAQIQLGQPVDITFDALGLDRKFQGKVEQINPASTIISGVVNYKVTVGLENISGVKPGMTANLNILTGSQSQVLAVPSRAILSQNGKKIVRVVTDPKTKAYKEMEVTTGLQADGGLVEITAGLGEGQEIITLLNSGQ